MIQRKIELTREEAELVYVQLNARKEHFEKLMLEAATKKDTDTVLEIARGIERIKSIQAKLIL